MTVLFFVLAGYVFKNAQIIVFMQINRSFFTISDVYCCSNIVVRYAVF